MKPFLKHIALSAMVLLGASSCNKDLLDLSPQDNYSDNSFWKTESQAIGYMDGIHNQLRDLYLNQILYFGEARGGTFRVGTGMDGSSLRMGEIVSQNFSQEKTGVSNWGGYYGPIAGLNLLIDKVSQANYIGQASKDFLLGQAYGLRAFVYFTLHKVYGDVPLRLRPDVAVGINNPTELYLERAKASEVLAQIKQDLDKSMEHFGNNTSFDGLGHINRKACWSRAATETLMGEVYLWTSKVSTLDATANTADLATAKQHLLNVVNNYNLGMVEQFNKVFDARDGKGNKEVIYAYRFAEGETSNNISIDFVYMDSDRGLIQKLYNSDGSKFGDPLSINGKGGGHWYEYKNELYNLYDAADTRRDATFRPVYDKDEGADTYTLKGTIVVKNVGYINTQGNRVFCGDYIVYRLPEVYLMLAEIANMEGDNATVETYINKVRQRAYGLNDTDWASSNYRYTASDFKTNELAILHEKDKEFVQEGKRWGDLRRMTDSKDGKHLVFLSEANYGSTLPILNESSEAYKVLWPVEKSLLDRDPKVRQTPGYEPQKSN